jgi:predicted AlkP superfamily pyrophosphatase or phosphodiesterase
MKQLFFSVLSSLLLMACAVAQPTSTGSENARRPKAIIGITVDQMRYDYIERYWNDYSAGGFKRLVNDGFFCRNLHYNYFPTYTAPGHASVFTGTTPAHHGIIENDWYDRYTNRVMYCSGDSTVVGVGTASNAGKMSPTHLLTTTIGDELKLFSNQRSRVFGIAMKDRGAILPAGRTADAAYWFVGGNEGAFVSSTWYMQELPQWVKNFNTSGKADHYMGQTWSLLRDASTYDESIEDNNAHEIPFRGTLKPVFPYVLKDLAASNGNYEMIKATPFGNDMTLDFAKALIENEKLGQGEFTDMLCLSFSSTDYIGHQFGIHSQESQDCYLRLDLLMEGFLNYLDSLYGKDNYLVFLSADHGGTPTPSYMAKRNGPYGYWKSAVIEEKIEEEFTKRYGAGDWVVNESNQNVFLNRKLIVEKKLHLNDLQEEAAVIVRDFPEVFMAFTAHELSNYSGGQQMRQLVERGFSQKYSGDIVYVLKPGYIEYGMGGTTHGSPYRYDTHVPGIFYGFGVNKGDSYAPYTITDIAPTVTSICKLPMTSGCTGEPIIEVIKK